MAFKEVRDSGQGEKFKFEKIGDSITGYYLGSGVIEINGSPVTKHSFKTKDGRELSPLGSADLDRRLSNVPTNMMARVTYHESKKLKMGKTLKVFKVEVDESDILSENSSVTTIPVSKPDKKLA